MDFFHGPSPSGPRIVVIGGGTGLSTMLRGLKHYSDDLTAVVTMSDDGGGSGRLRSEIGMPPPGDVRNCILALSNTEAMMEKLLLYRFTEGSLAGQNMGNLFLAALCGICGSFEQAVSSMSEILAVKGRVLPVTSSDIALEAIFDNGAVVRGESRIFQSKKQLDCRIRRVRLVPERPAALPDVLESIRAAELIVLGPGSLYTSVIPNLLVDGVCQAILDSDALKVYVCNIMTQDGETEGYTASDHVRAIFDHSCPGLFSLCLVNSEPLPERLRAQYESEGAEPLHIDFAALSAMGIETVLAPLASNDTDFARHDPDRLARTLLRLHASRSVRLADGSRYVLETSSGRGEL